jgi:hypothetical protein
MAYSFKETMRGPDIFDYLAFAWNLACCLFATVLAIFPIGFAMVCIYATLGCRIAQLFN